jgi:hypothetical protein
MKIFKKNNQKKSRVKEGVSISDLITKPYLNEEEVSLITGRAISTLRNDRHLRRGIPYLKIGRRAVRYKLDDTLSFMEARRISFD